MNLFWKDRRALEPTASVKILYITLEKPFFMATRQKGRSNTDIYNIFFYQTLSYLLSFFHKMQKKKWNKETVFSPWLGDYLVLTYKIAKIEKIVWTFFLCLKNTRSIRKAIILKAVIECDRLTLENLKRQILVSQVNCYSVKNVLLKKWDYWQLFFYKTSI